jgi:cytochrome-b5 reductase
MHKTLTGNGKSSLPLALSTDDFKPIQLISKSQLSHDVQLFRFQLPTGTILGLPVGQHITFKFVDTETEKDVIRSYTPIKSDESTGIVEFCIKIYFKDTHPNFPAGGKMSQHLNNLSIGDHILMRGPKGNITYHESGLISIQKSPKLHQKQPKKIGLIAGGTGITPMLQVIQHILDMNFDIEISLLFANQTENDIFMKDFIESLPSDRVHVWYTIDKALNPETWNYSTGYINSKMIQDHLPAPHDDHLIFVCGPLPMIKYACEPAFKELGFEEGHWFAF